MFGDRLRSDRLTPGGSPLCAVAAGLEEKGMELGTCRGNDGGLLARKTSLKEIGRCVECLRQVHTARIAKCCPAGSNTKRDSGLSIPNLTQRFTILYDL